MASDFITGRGPGDERDETPEVAGGEREALDLADIARRLDAADEMVAALCRPRGTEGAKRWTMSIPARPDSDPDLVIADALHAAREMLALLSARPAPERERPACVVPRHNFEARRVADVFYPGMGGYQQWLHGDRETWLPLFSRPEPVSEPEPEDVYDQWFRRLPGNEHLRGEPERAPGAGPVGPHVPDDVVRLYRDHAGFHYAINALAASSDPTQVLQLVCRMREQIPSFASPPSERAGKRELRERAGSPEVERLRELAEASVAYDDAIRACANDPETMSSFCTAQGDDLDSLYFRWMTLARRALATPSESGTETEGEHDCGAANDPVFYRGP